MKKNLLELFFVLFVTYYTSQTSLMKIEMNCLLCCFSVLFLLVSYE